tara:strand:- start:1290 stop:1760 length:471 start_codon:yes stop_codon:yes gene_type:complete
LLDIEQIFSEVNIMAEKSERELFAEKYGLSRDSYWKHKQSGEWLITHEAVEKVAGIEGITCKYQDVESRYDVCVAIKCIATRGDITIESYGEASPQNCMSNYYYAMAEKRGYDRAVLKLIDAYDLFYSDAEIETKTNDKNVNKKGKSEQDLDSHDG